MEVRTLLRLTEPRSVEERESATRSDVSLRTRSSKTHGLEVRTLLRLTEPRSAAGRVVSIAGGDD